jgi:hypothetical protein
MADRVVAASVTLSLGLYEAMYRLTMSFARSGGVIAGLAARAARIVS